MSTPQLPTDHPNYNQYIATYRVVFRSGDDLEAQVIAEHLRAHIEEELDLDDDDSVDMTQVVSFGEALTAEESAIVLKRARNVLIKLRTADAWDYARKLDELAFILTNRREETGSLNGYDYSRFMEIAADIYRGKYDID